jgi:hypothetical protein
MEIIYLSTSDGVQVLNASSTSTSDLPSRCQSKTLGQNMKDSKDEHIFSSMVEPKTVEEKTPIERACDAQHKANHDSMAPCTKQPLRGRLKSLFSSGGKL